MPAELLPLDELFTLATLRVSLDDAVDTIGKDSTMNFLLMGVTLLFTPKSFLTAREAACYVFGSMRQALMLLQSEGGGKTEFAEASVRETDAF